LNERNARFYKDTTMSLSLSEVSIPVIIHALQSLIHVLNKAEVFAREQSIEDTVLLNTRLHPTMLPLIKQVHIATDVARRGISRLVGSEPMICADDETTFAQLIARIEQNITILQQFDTSVINASEDKLIELSVGGNQLSFNGRNYVQLFIVPNIYFHVTTTYAILRHCGVVLGKADFLGKIQ
jgi:hypothetical protein